MGYELPAEEAWLPLQKGAEGQSEEALCFPLGFQSRTPAPCAALQTSLCLRALHGPGGSAPVAAEPALSPDTFLVWPVLLAGPCGGDPVLSVFSHRLLVVGLRAVAREEWTQAAFRGAVGPMRRVSAPPSVTETLSCFFCARQ